MNLNSRLKVVMDVIKTELEVDPLALETSDDTDEEEKKCILESVHISTQMKTECEDNSYHLTSGMKAEAKEGNLSHLELMVTNTECWYNNYDIKTEMNLEDASPVPTSFPMVKSEVDEDSSDLDRVQQEQKMEASIEDDEVFPESHIVAVLSSNLLQHEEPASPPQGDDGCHPQRLVVLIFEQTALLLLYFPVWF
ncbi:uncharacterized protein [Periplaneta americana]|uniref:uncharacterized protein isoform X5 n=1 Tax=Periplaneta americana TaxID=6978 RepID=UPI0037E86789